MATTWPPHPSLSMPGLVSSAVARVTLCSAGQEANENQPLLLLRRLRGQAGPSLALDELLHRCGTGIPGRGVEGGGHRVVLIILC